MTGGRGPRRGKGAWPRCLILGIALAAPGIRPRALKAQRLAAEPLTLSEALDRAGANPRGALAAVDSAAAAARLAAARLLPDPSLVATLTRDQPHWHVEADTPLDLPWIRGPRIDAARWSARAALAVAAGARASLEHDITVAYEQAVAARAVAELSTDVAADARRVLNVARARRAAGDVAEIDELLAALEEGRSRGAALSDSVAARAAVLALQALLLLPVDAVVVDPVTPLSAPLAETYDSPDASAALPFAVASAEADTRAAAARARLARVGRFPAPGLIVGVEGGAGPGEPSLLPLVGVSFDLPVFSRGRPDIEAARFDLEASRLRLDVATRATADERARSERASAVARGRVAVNEGLVGDAERVAALTLTGYQEGALPLTQVVEARRLALEARSDLIQRLLELRLAEADLRLALAAGVWP